MKNLIAFIAISFACTQATAQNVAINADSSLPHSSAILDVKSSTKGMLIPRTSTTSRLSISNPAKGLMIYDTTTGSCWFYNGNIWMEQGAANNTWNIVGNSGTTP